MWTVTLLLPTLSAALTSDHFSVQAGSFLNPAFSSHNVSSLQRCAARCGHLQPEYCDGFRYGSGGLCELIVDQHHCLVTGPPPLTNQTRSYARGALTRVTDLCAPGWIAFDGSCYLRSNVQQSRGKWNKGCPTSCSKPVSINHDLELTFLSHHSSRPGKAEWVGPIKKTVAVGVNPDGSDFSTSVQISVSGTGDCFSLPNDHVADRLIKGPCGTKRGAVCESLQPLGLLTGCPADWLQVDDHCYLLVAMPMTFHTADGHCAQLEPGARLGQPQEAGMDAILSAYANMAGLNGSFWVGVHDETNEGSWESLDGSPWHFSGWDSSALQPNAERNCLKIGINDAAVEVRRCDWTYSPLCHVPREQPKYTQPSEP